MDKRQEVGNRLIRINHIEVSVERWDYVEGARRQVLQKVRARLKFHGGWLALREWLWGIILATFVLGDYKFSHDPINSQNRRQIFNRITAMRMFARLLCGSLERHVFLSAPYFIVTLCNIVKEISPLLLREKVKNSEKQSFSKNFNFCTQLREIIFLFRILSAMIIKIATYRIYLAYRRCNYRVYRPVRFAHLSGLLFRGRNPSRIRWLQDHLRSVLINVRLSKRDIASSTEVPTWTLHRLGYDMFSRYRFTFIDFVLHQVT